MASIRRASASQGPSRRKRSHAEITRSEDHSSSPEAPSSKRRRTGRSDSISSISSFSSDSDSSSDFESPSPEPAVRHRQIRRQSRDGLDLRRPIMSRPNIAARNTPSNTIDLTAEDDVSPPPTRRMRPPPITAALPTETFYSPSPTQRQPPIPELRQGVLRGPPFVNRHVEVIDVSDEEDTPETFPDLEVFPDALPPPRRLPTRISSSPDVQFMGERVVRRDRPAFLAAQAAQQPAGDRHILGEMLARGTQIMLQTFNPATYMGNRPRQDIATPFDARLQPADDFDGLRFDYQQPAFEMGSRESTAPQMTTEPYKAPPPAAEGFTRDVDEDEIVVCPYCDDELATGEGEIKQQVWIVRQCGHVYCGACATNRALSKGSKKDKKAANSRKNLPFKTCVVDGCGKSVTGKGTMFQIYL